MSETYLTWVYAVARDLDPAILVSVDGIGGGPVRPVADAVLTAVTGPVAAAAFGGEALQRRLSEPGELEAIARAHHGVIAAVAAACPVLPLRLGTVYHDDDRVRELLARRRDEFAATLGQLADRVECGVKVWARPAALAGAAASEPPGPPAGPGGRDRPGAGAAYLSRRRAQLAARDDWQLRAAEQGAAIHGELSELAAAARRHPLQDQPPAATAGQEAAGQMVLNGAYLVPSAGAAQFAAAARAVVADLAGFRLEVTGPWPPYSFADGTGTADDQP